MAGFIAHTESLNPLQALIVQKRENSPEAEPCLTVVIWCAHISSYHPTEST